MTICTAPKILPVATKHREFFTELFLVVIVSSEGIYRIENTGISCKALVVFKLAKASFVILNPCTLPGFFLNNELINDKTNRNKDTFA